MQSSGQNLKFFFKYITTSCWKTIWGLPISKLLQWIIHSAVMYVSSNNRFLTTKLSRMHATAPGYKAYQKFKWWNFGPSMKSNGILAATCIIEIKLTRKFGSLMSLFKRQQNNIEEKNTWRVNGVGANHISNRCCNTSTPGQPSGPKYCQCQNTNCGTTYLSHEHAVFLHNHMWII